MLYHQVSVPYTPHGAVASLIKLSTLQKHCPISVVKSSASLVTQFRVGLLSRQVLVPIPPAPWEVSRAYSGPLRSESWLPDGLLGQTHHSRVLKLGGAT